MHSAGRSVQLLSFVSLITLLVCTFVGCGSTPSGGAVSGPGGMPPGSLPTGPSGGGQTATGDYVYATAAGSGIAAYALESDGSLTGVAGSPFPSAGAASVLADPLGRYLWAASGAQITSYAVNGNGSLAQTSSLTSPQQSFAGLLTVDPQGQSLYVRNIFANNLDFNQGVQNYSTGAGGALAFRDFVYNFGTQAMVITPDGSGAYIGWGYHFDSEVSAYTRSSGGTLSRVSSVFGPPDPSNGFTKVITALAMDPQGQYVIAEWGHLTQILPPDTATPELGVYRIGADQSLTQVGGSIDAPQANFAVFDPSGNFLLLATDSGINVFSFDRAAAALSSSSSVAGPALDRLAFSRSGQFILATSPSAGQLMAYSFNNGSLTPAPGSPQAVPQASSVAVVHK